MKRYGTKNVPAKVEQVVLAKQCDLCFKESPDHFDDNWAPDRYDVDEVEVRVTVRHRKGESFPEGGSLEQFHPDICPSCFTDKILPVLRSLGLKIDYVDVSW